MRTISPDALQAAAANFLSTDSQVLAWEEASAARAMRLVQAFAEGRMATPALQAALGGAPTRPATPAPTGTAVVPLIGPMTPGASIFTLLGLGTSMQTFGQQLRAAAADASIGSIFLLVDSPGGQVGMVEETAALVRRIAASKPVVAAVVGLNASAAYWVTAGASSIDATPSAEIGSVGVFTTRVSIARQLERDGVDVAQISAGRFKGEGNPMLPMSDEERRAKQQRVDDTYAQFVADVALGRHVSTTQVRAGFGEGRVVMARRALELGMIDRVALIDETYQRNLQESSRRSRLGATVVHHVENERAARLL